MKSRGFFIFNLAITQAFRKKYLMEIVSDIIKIRNDYFKILKNSHQKLEIKKFIK